MFESYFEFLSGPVLIVIEGDEFMTYMAYHQGAFKIFWLHLTLM